MRTIVFLRPSPEPAGRIEVRDRLPRCPTRTHTLYCDPEWAAVNSRSAKPAELAPSVRLEFAAGADFADRTLRHVRSRRGASRLAPK